LNWLRRIGRLGGWSWMVCVSLARGPLICNVLRSVSVSSAAADLVLPFCPLIFI
jgi:hypothetical protein